MTTPNFADKTVWTGDNLDILRGKGGATAVRALQPGEGGQAAGIPGGVAAGDGDGGVREAGGNG